MGHLPILRADLEDVQKVAVQQWNFVLQSRALLSTASAMLRSFAIGFCHAAVLA